MLNNLPDIEIAKVLRQTYILAAGIAAVALVVSAVLGNILIGLGVVIGLLLGAFNGRGARRSIANFAARGAQGRRQTFVFAGMARLAVVTAIAVAMLVFARSLAWGALGGLAIFQLTMLANASRLMLHTLRDQSS
jgi:hypothetical protein